MVEDCEDYSMTAQFWKAYVKNLKHGIPLSLVLLVACGSILMDVRMVEAHTGDTTGLLTAGILLLLLLLIHFLYLKKVVKDRIGLKWQGALGIDVQKLLI